VGEIVFEDAEIVARTEHYMQLKNRSKTLLAVFSSSASAHVSTLEKVTLAAGTRMTQVRGSLDLGGDLPLAPNPYSTFVITELNGKTRFIPFAEIERVRYYPMPAKLRYALVGLGLDVLCYAVVKQVEALGRSFNESWRKGW
jgi:hypothetical protein